MLSAKPCLHVCNVIYWIWRNVIMRDVRNVITLCVLQNPDHFPFRSKSQAKITQLSLQTAINILHFMCKDHTAQVKLQEFQERRLSLQTAINILHFMCKDHNTGKTARISGKKTLLTSYHTQMARVTYTENKALRSWQYRVVFYSVLTLHWKILLHSSKISLVSGNVNLANILYNWCRSKSCAEQSLLRLKFGHGLLNHQGCMDVYEPHFKNDERHSNPFENFGFITADVFCVLLVQFCMLKTLLLH